MGSKARTKDESFIVKLYEEAQKLPDINDPQDRYTIGQMVGLQKKAVDTICVLLAQANFIKKKGDVDIAITSNGIELALTVLDN